jgi:hypothetical protein
MKKYRSLWYMSTTNHNILYFHHIPGIQPLNSGICLWKVENSLVVRGLQGLKICPESCERGCLAASQSPV